MNILLLGEGGGRDHALAWKIAQSPVVTRFFITKRNAGMLSIGEEALVDANNHKALVAFCKELSIELAVVSPDALLASGVVDALTEAGIPAFGPTKAAAQIEWSKAYAKQVMEEEGIPTARGKTFTDYIDAKAYVDAHPLPVVVKASGLARGKGVTVAASREEAVAALQAAMVDDVFEGSGKEVVIEEFLEGTEISIHALAAGDDAVLFPPSKDHKRVFDDDKGPNTGGMGAIVPVPVPEGLLPDVRDTIVLPLLRGLKKRDRSFYGLLYPGLMLTAQGPKVVEFNARFGDPEAEVYMRLLQDDVVPALLAIAHGSLPEELQWSSNAVAGIMMASGGYPDHYEKGKIITGIEEAEKSGAVVFHAGTKMENGKLVTNGGRVLNVTATGKDLSEALQNTYAAIGRISFEGAHYRTDIGKRALR